MEKPRPISETHPHLKDFLVFLEHLNNESERGQVLICASMIDDLLMRILQAFLIDGKSSSKLLIGFNAPLGSFSARQEATHAMGLVTELEYRDIKIIREIRNGFAHGISASFEDKSIISKCAELSFAAKSYEGCIVNVRSQFSTAATAVILQLTNRPYYVSRKRLTKQAWPY